MSNKLKHLSDGDLISRYKNSGDNVFVGELFERYTHLVFGVCLKYLRNVEDSHDATLEIFEKLIDDLLKYEVSNFKAWLHSVARNYCFMKLRREKNHAALTGDFTEIVEKEVLLHQVAETGNEVKLAQLESAIAQLSKEQKVCIEMFYIKQQSYQEITQSTGFSFNEVKSFIQNGKRNLKIALSKQYERED